ncbi:MAG TPA: hypothetical protein VF844_05630, partial [Ktedonobacteraceae bacterium]
MSKDGHIRTVLFLTQAQKRIGGKQTGNGDPPKWAKKGVMEMALILLDLCTENRLCHVSDETEPQEPQS